MYHTHLLKTSILNGNFQNPIEISQTSEKSCSYRQIVVSAGTAALHVKVADAEFDGVALSHVDVPNTRDVMRVEVRVVRRGDVR